MKPFRNRRDPEGKFALTTPQNPNLNNLPHFPADQVNEQLLEIRRRADAAARQNAASDAAASDAASKKDVAAPAATSKSRESHTPHVPFAPAPSAAPPESGLAANADAAASQNEAASDAASKKDVAAPAATSKSRESHTPHVPFAPASAAAPPESHFAANADAAASQNEAASDAASQKDVAAPAATSKSRESHTPHVPFAPASSAAPPESHFAANADVDEQVESKIESAPESAHSSKPRESHTPHVPFAPASAVAPSPASRAPEQPAADADLVAHLSFLQKIATQANIPLDFLSPDPLVPEPAQPLAAAPPAAPARTFKRRPRRLPRTTASIAARVPACELTSLERHARKCQICKHPDREEIDQEFLRWQHPIFIAEEFNLPETRIIYAHARATGLLRSPRPERALRPRFFHRRSQPRRPQRRHHRPSHSRLHPHQRPRRMATNSSLPT